MKSVLMAYMFAAEHDAEREILANFISVTIGASSHIAEKMEYYALFLRGDMLATGCRVVFVDDIGRQEFISAISARVAQGDLAPFIIENSVAQEDIV